MLFNLLTLTTEFDVPLYLTSWLWSLLFMFIEDTIVIVIIVRSQKKRYLEILDRLNAIQYGEEGKTVPQADIVNTKVNGSMGNGQAVAGFILSLMGLVLAFLSGIFSVVALPISIVGLILSVTGGKKLRSNNQSNGFATTGLVLGVIAVIISTITFFTCGICVLCGAAIIM